MSIDPTLLERADNQCELCASADTLTAYDVTPDNGAPTDSSAYATYK